MDDRLTVVVDDDTYLQRLASPRGADKHRDRRVVGLERSPVMSKSVQHVLVVDTVLAGTWIDVHHVTLGRRLSCVNIC